MAGRVEHCALLEDSGRSNLFLVACFGEVVCAFDEENLTIQQNESGIDSRSVTVRLYADCENEHSHQKSPHEAHVDDNNNTV